MHKVTISGKGLIAIPAELCRRYDLKKGDQLILRESEDSILICPLAEKPLLQLRGKYKDSQAEALNKQLLKERSLERKKDVQNKYLFFQ